MIYAYDQYTPLPVLSIYDTQMMLASVGAAKDMYEKGLQEMKDFKNEYGNFMSPFAKDMARYGEMVGGVKNAINTMYANGIDPLRSPEGRATLSRIINQIDPAEYNAMKANAKIGYAYMEAMLKLNQEGRYSQQQEDFDIRLNNGTRFDDFSTLGSGGKINNWTRTSPVRATTLQELTRKSYEGRTPRTLSAEDFKNDPRLKGQAYDPRYEYTGYLDSDLMKVAPGASASLAGDTRAAYFRDQARQKVIAAGLQPTEGNIEAQFQRDIADANDWALVDPVRRADEFAKMRQQYSYSAALQNLEHKNKMDEINAANAGKNGDVDDGNYLRGISIDAAQTFRSMTDRIVADHSGVLALVVKQHKDNPQKLEKALLKTVGYMFFKDPKYGDGKRSVVQLIRNLPGVNNKSGDTANGLKSIDILNGILKNFAANSDNVQNAEVLLKKAGYVYNGDKNYWVAQPGASKIVSPHELMRNIISYQFGNVSGVSKKELIDKLEKSAGGYGGLAWYDVTWRAPGERAAKFSGIYPNAADKGVLIAPDEDGINKLWVRVGVKDDAWFHADKTDGLWMAVPGVTYGKAGTTTSDSEASIYSSGVQERKQFTNAAVSSEYKSMR